MRKYLLLSFLILCFKLQATETQNNSNCNYKDEFIETKHEAVINGKTVPYKAVVGTLSLKGENCNPKASLSFVSYTRQDADQNKPRPITFCFNGGPGSSSVWLHIGGLGPRRIVFNPLGDPIYPTSMEDNPYSLLDLTDLVFVDPVSTGFSRAIPPETNKNYHSVLEDIKSVGEFIRIYLTHFERWDSPRFLAGESYGTTRVSALADHLHHAEYIDFEGIILVSCALNFATLDFNENNDLPYALFLPTYATTAWYHHKLPLKYQSLSVEDVFKLASDFVSSSYTTALFKGDLLQGTEKMSTLQKFSELTGLSPTYIEAHNFRVDMPSFAKELLRKDKKVIGRFDSRICGLEQSSAGEHATYDPVMDMLLGPFTSVFNNYLRKDLGWKENLSYKILTNVFPWDFGCSNEYLYVGDNLRNVVMRAPHTKVFVASGYYDLATPLGATDYTLSHMNLDPCVQPNVVRKNYKAGHILFLVPEVMQQLKADLTDFYDKALCPSRQPKP